MRIKALTRLLFMVAGITWVALLFTDLSVVFSVKTNMDPDIPTWLPGLLFNLFLVALYYFYKYRIDRDELLNFVDLLWRVFATGLVVTVISLLIRLIEYLPGTTKLTSLFIYVEANYIINLGLIAGFLMAAYTVWKRLILYQKSKWLLRLWSFFEGGLLVALVYNSLEIDGFDWLNNVLLGLLIVIGLVLSANMKWVAYLNFRQKWTSLLLLLLAIFYVMYLFYTANAQAISAFGEGSGFVDHRYHIFFQSLFIFVTVYSVFSFLVILFNLPTTSVFEQKLEEVVNFQRISQSIQTEQSEESVYNILLETSVSTVFADAAWLEIKNNEHDHRLFTYHITEKEAHDIIEHLKKEHVTGILEQSQDKTKNLSKHLSSLRGSRFRSILAFPIYVKGENIGTLALLKELSDGFNREMTKIVSTFANQAGISIENFRLLEEALQSERYKEELKIAKAVQKSLLPQVLDQHTDFDLAAFSESADEVGGDYYDTLRISDQQVALIVADVSGKGTTAAFHMSQMKGIFHSLAQNCIQPAEFMVRSNKALANCLERGSFISATFFVIDVASKSVSYSRAGHCPLLYYTAAAGTAAYRKDKGVALGMVRNNGYEKFIEAHSIPYQAGDIMVLYTDGITEAKNSKGEEFGYDRLSEAILEVKDRSSREIQEHLINRLYEFTGTENINDDYTTMIVKFK
ncbi:MAG: SpoIIE family protein phosphatase [Cyclobacteriaceae bacterium]|nr:SpoIIE family protein phosphatase [Cyclobacteriaceae bacterium]UYN86693.1 MAG: SpoIIE family protein phosphatase [Cyclobacteriaceae bacterium]